MRVLIYSDVHANLEALETMAEFTSGKYDTSLCLGDLVGYGADPNGTAAWVRMHTPLIVRGNHDRACAELHGIENFTVSAAIAARWTHHQLEPELRDWLAALPQGPLHWHEVELVHGSPLDEDQYVSRPTEARPIFAATTARLQFFGHTHVQGGFVHDGAGSLTPISLNGHGPTGATQVTVPLDAARRYLINPGSVGQPRDGDWRAAFAVLETDEANITFYRLPYDLEKAQEKIRAAELPPGLASRLARGR